MGAPFHWPCWIHTGWVAWYPNRHDEWLSNIVSRCLTGLSVPPMEKWYGMKLTRRDFRSMWACTYVEDVSPLLLNSRQTTFEWPQVRTGCDETRCDSRVVDLAWLGFYGRTIISMGASWCQEPEPGRRSMMASPGQHNSLQNPCLIAHMMIGRYSSFSTHIL